MSFTVHPLMEMIMDNGIKCNFFRVLWILLKLNNNVNDNKKSNNNIFFSCFVKFPKRLRIIESLYALKSWLQFWFTSKGKVNVHIT